MEHVAPKRSNTSQVYCIYTHITLPANLKYLKDKHNPYSQINRGLIVDVYLQDVLILGTRYREVSHTPVVVPPCKKLYPLHGKLGGSPGGSKAVAKKNSPLPLEILSGFSSRIVRKVVSLSTERPSSHRTASFSGEPLLCLYV